MRVAVLCLLVLGGCGMPTSPNSAIGHERRVEVVEMIRAGRLTETDEFGSVILPDEYAGLSQSGKVTVRDDPFMIFFLTWTGFGPDPYCGSEYSEDSTAVAADPLFSGNGDVRPVDGAEGWYWLCAR